MEKTPNRQYAISSSPVVTRHAAHDIRRATLSEFNSDSKSSLPAVRISSSMLVIEKPSELFFGS